MQGKEKQHEQRIEQQQQQQTDHLECAECGYMNEPETLYCEQCGSNLQNKTKKCPVCGEKLSGVYCEFCGANSDGIMCPKCNIIQYTDFCSDCGEPLTETAKNFISIDTEKIEIQEMTEADAALIIHELNNCLTPVMQKEQEKKRQRIILLREREYFNEREKRIEEFYPSGIIKVKTIKPEEMKLLKKSVEKLRGYIKAEKDRINEIIQVQEEKERMAKEKQKNEQYKRRVEGVWITTSGRVSGIMKINLNGTSVRGNIHWIQPELERVDSLCGSWDGNVFMVRTINMRTIWIRPNYYNVPVKYLASVNQNSDTMNGYMESAEYWQEIFIKQ